MDWQISEGNEIANMNKHLSVLLLFMLVSCSTNVQDEGYLGTWIYTVEDAPFGFQRGKVIFYEEGDSTRAKLKVYGLSMGTENLVIDGAMQALIPEEMILGRTFTPSWVATVQAVRKSLPNT